MAIAPGVRTRLPSTGVSIFAVMSRLAEEHGAINLSQGFPDFDCAPELIDTVARYMREGHNQYWRWSSPVTRSSCSSRPMTRTRRRCS